MVVPFIVGLGDKGLNTRRKSLLKGGRPLRGAYKMLHRQLIFKSAKPRLSAGPLKGGAWCRRLKS